MRVKKADKRFGDFLKKCIQIAGKLDKPCQSVVTMRKQQQNGSAEQSTVPVQMGLEGIPPMTFGRCRDGNT